MWQRTLGLARREQRQLGEDAVHGDPRRDAEDGEEPVRQQPARRRLGGVHIDEPAAARQLQAQWLGTRRCDAAPEQPWSGAETLAVDTLNLSLSTPSTSPPHTTR